MKNNYERLKNKRILLVEDNQDMAGRIFSNLEDKGCIVTHVTNVEDTERILEEIDIAFDIALVDMYIPENSKNSMDRIMRGEQLAYSIRKKYPDTIIISMSVNFDRKPHTAINDLFSGFIPKDGISNQEFPILLFETLDGILMDDKNRKPKTFIVHGHDNGILSELKDYIQNTLKLGEPIILRDRPSLGKTIIEKFESEARNIDLVFVLMTPDDEVINSNNKRRARQNVIFEAGFFFAKMQRTSGRVIVLQKGQVELPSDISGLIYIDITNGIRMAGEDIRRELSALGWC